MPPPTSVLVARDPGGYLAGLHWFRTGEPWRWVRWFSGVVEAAAEAATRWAVDLAALLDGWRRRLADLRQGSAARSALDLLASHPVVSAGLVAEQLGISDTATRRGLQILAERGPSSPTGEPRGVPVDPGNGGGRPGWSRCSAAGRAEDGRAEGRAG